MTTDPGYPDRVEARLAEMGMDMAALEKSGRPASTSTLSMIWMCESQECSDPDEQLCWRHLLWSIDHIQSPYHVATTMCEAASPLVLECRVYSGWLTRTRDLPCTHARPRLDQEAREHQERRGEA